MEDFIFFLHTQQQYIQYCVAAVTVAVTFYFTCRLICTTDDGAPIDFRVPAPEQCRPDWAGRLLDEPGIKVEYRDQTGILITGLIQVRLQDRVPYNATARPMGDSLD